MTMAQVTVVAKVTAKQEAVEAVKAEVLKLIEPTRREEGCILYTLHQDDSDPAVFMFYETWESPAHLDRHMKTEHFTRYVAAVDGLLHDKVVNRLTRIA
jgi:quinol monooxygenase YgiN